MVQLQAEIVEGPLDHPLFGRCVVIRPTVETTRANRHPSQAVVVTTAARRLIELSKGGEKLPRVVVEGDKDPTTHPDFLQISEQLRELTNKWFPKAKLTLHSLNADLSRPEVRHALNSYDTPILVLGAGTRKTLSKLSGESGESFKARIENMRRVESERLIVRSSFVRGTTDNSTDSEVRAWLRNLTGIRPAAIQITTLARAGGGQKPVTKTRMAQIAELAQEKTGVQVEVLEQ